jgi:acyl-CoA thioesterase
VTHNEQGGIPPELLRQTTNSSGFLELLGMQVDTASSGVGRMHIQVDDRLMHPHQVVHGGVIFALADTTMALALLSALPAGTRTSTIEAKINFFLPVLTGELAAEAMIVHQGRSTAVLEAKVYNIHEGERRIIACMLGTFSISRPKSAESTGERS